VEIQKHQLLGGRMGSREAEVLHDHEVDHWERLLLSTSLFRHAVIERVSGARLPFESTEGPNVVYEISTVITVAYLVYLRYVHARRTGWRPQ